MEKFPGMDKTDLLLCKEIIKILSNEPTSERAMQKRKDFFHPKQKLACIRYFFNNLPQLILTDDELSNIKRIIVKPKSSEWSIIGKIIKYQTPLDEQQLVEWFNCVQPLDRRSIAMVVIGNYKISNIGLKLQLVKEMMEHVNYIKPVIDFVDAGVQYEDIPLYKSIVEIVLEYINKDDEYSKVALKQWVLYGKHLNKYAEKYQMVSMSLYRETGLEHYLPKEAKDIFVF